MSKIVRYTNSGHRFEVEGLIEAGNTVTVTAIPAVGYEFIQWLTGNTNITELTPDSDGNRRFSIYIEECGLSFSALFGPIPPDPTGDCDKSTIYNRAVEILYQETSLSPYMPWNSTEDITCAAIDGELDTILGLNNNIN